MCSPVTYTAVKPKPTPVSSLVFFDLETTGLPSYHKVKITELCLCAVERDHFLNSMGKLPRVTNRLTLCMYPGRMIDLKATELTQLDNYVLQNQSRFDENVYNMISSFLNRLRPPVCLVAHNGTRFDFPILKAEIENLGKKLPEDLLCVDSLSIFKTLYEFEEVEELILHDDSTSSTSSNFSPLASSTSPTSSPLASSTSPTSSPLTSSTSPTSSFSITMLKTPEKEIKKPSLVTPITNLNIKTPVKNYEQLNIGTMISTLRSPTCKKRLPFGKSPSPTKKQKFDLTSIYKRFYHEEPCDSHSAESDVSTLLLSAIKVALEFLDVVDQSANTFDSIPKLW